MKEIRYFQWVIGEKKGQIQIFDRIDTDDGALYIVFKDGSRINETLVAPLNAKDLTNKMMAEIDHPDNPWKLKEEWVGRQEEVWELNAEQERVCVQPFVEGRKVINLIPPRPTAPRSSSFGQISNPTPAPLPSA